MYSDIKNELEQAAKSEKDILVAEFQALKTTAEALQTAMDNA